jgi:hypothetical protein
MTIVQRFIAGFVATSDESPVGTAELAGSFSRPYWTALYLSRAFPADLSPGYFHAAPTGTRESPNITLEMWRN